jgi:hypothetical protein
MKVTIKCPDRIGFHGFYAAGRYFPVGETEHDFPESVVRTLEEEVLRRESILEIRRVEEAKPEPKKKG